MLKKGFVAFLSDAEGEGLLLRIYREIGGAYAYYNKLQEDVERLKRGDLDDLKFWDEFWTQIAYPSDSHMEHSLYSEEMSVLRRLYDSNKIFREGVDFQKKLISEVSEVQVSEDLKAIDSIEDWAMASYGGIDLTPAGNVLQNRSVGEGIEFHINPAQLAKFQNALGFTVDRGSITIQLLKSLPEFLGIA